MGFPATGGRPVKVLTEKDVIKLEALARVLTKSQVASYFGITEKTLRAIEERQPEVSTAYSKGKAMAIADVATSLYEQAKSGNIQAAKFYLKTQAGWREQETTAVTASPDNVIQIIRASMSD